MKFTDTTGRASNWSPPVEFVVAEQQTAADLQNYLRITEVMYNPPAGGYEFVELHNASSSTTLDLAGVKFTQGIDYTFSAGTSIPPGGYLVLTKAPSANNFADFRAFYGLDPGVPVVGPYSGSLDNAGELVTLRTAAGGTDIVSFNYGDGRGWPQAADGAGHSLVLLDTAEVTQGSGSGDYGRNWRASAYLRGSPGRADATPPAGPVVNEIAAHTDYSDPAHPEFDSNDWIELYNPTSGALALGPGWYLSDDGANLTKWAIPSNTVIAAHGFVNFDEVTGFHNPTNIGFGLNKAGEQVFLSYLPGTAQDRIVDAVTFKGQENGWTYGRYPDGGPYWEALTPPTRGTTNRAPGLHVIINELHYHPPDIGGTNDNVLDEFIELSNPTGSAVPLFNTNGTWRIDGGVDFALPANLTLGAGEFLVLVSFDPAADPGQLAVFRGLYGITNAGLKILGPYSGKLANSSARVALEKPQAGDLPGDSISWIEVDEAIYADQSPWPCGTDGTGASLQRQNLAGYGNDPLKWAGGPPTPGRDNVALPPGAPIITVPPTERIVGTNAPATFSVVLCGPTPYFYQWLFNGAKIVGATNALFAIANAQLSDAGFYSVIVSNLTGFAASDPARLIVQFPPVVVEPPTSQTVVQYQSATFHVTVDGTPPLFYQWRYSGANITGATNATFVLTNLDPAQSGAYSVQVWNAAASTILSVTLTVLPLPVITQPPSGTNIATGINLALRVIATGTGPLLYQWQWNGANLAGATNSTLTLTNLQIANSGAYRVLVTDNVGTRTSQEASVIVLEKPAITAQPTDQTVAVGQPLTLTVQTTGTQPMWYRWRRNSSLYLWPGPATLTVSNAALTNAGKWDVVITNLANAILGGNTLSARVNVNVVQPPTSQSALPGTNVTLQAIVSMPQTFTNFFWWVFNGEVLQAGTNTSTATLTMFTNELALASFTATQAGDYTFVISNYFFVTNGSIVTTNFVGAPAAFTATLRAGEPDSDGDGIPDAWTRSYFGHPSGQAGDISRAGDDADGDHMTNLQEYLAGTNPRDPNSVLKLAWPKPAAAPASELRLQFDAMSNHTYDLEFKETLGPGAWSNLANFPRQPTNRVIAVTNAIPPGLLQRLFRVKTGPAQ